MAFIFILILSLFAFTANSQNLRFTNFNSEKDLSQPYVYVILQDANGYLWIGTGDGLSSYNGSTFDHYSEKDSLADNFIRCGIAVGNDLWLGHMNGNITFYQNRKFKKILTDIPNAGPVTHMSKSPSGSIWFSQYAGYLNKINKNNSVQRNFFKDAGSITCFEFIDDRQVLLGTEEGLKVITPGNGDEVSLVDAIPVSKITGIIRCKKSRSFFIATENDGIYSLEVTSNKVKASRIPAGELTNVQDIMEDSKGKLWLATLGNGAIKIDPALNYQVFIYNKKSGLATDNVKTLFEDREGLIWSGNYGEGLTQIAPRPYSLIKYNPETYGNNITAVFIHKYDCWLGTEKGLIRTDKENGKVISLFKLPVEDNITSIYSADGIEFWIGTANSGVFRLNRENREMSSFHLSDNAPENSITKIAGHKNLIWIATRKGLCEVSLPEDSTRWYTINQGGLPHNYINSLFADENGTLWISSNSSTLAYLKDHKIYKMQMGSGRDVLTLGQVAQDAGGRIWAGSFGSGVFIVSKDSVLNLNTRQGLMSDYCYSVACDGVDHIWVGHRGGISRIRTSDFTIMAFHDPENLTEDCQFNRNAIAADSQVAIMGTDKGLYSYRTDYELHKVGAPVLNILSIRVNDEEIDPLTRRIYLSSGSYKIRIEYLGVSLKDPGYVTYQYRLEGYDQWSEITKDNSVTYSHLSGGQYKFILKASDSKGYVTINPLAIEILIHQPVWKNWWFYTTAILILVILMFVFFRWRLYRLKLEKNILEEKVQKRTYEIECQKNELAVQRDMIENKNASITSSITYARQIQNALLPPDELIDKLLPGNFILSRPKDIVSGDFYWIASRDNKIIVTVADCTGHGVPGSFMSLLGITLLSEVVNLLGIIEPHEILNSLRDKVIGSLQQNRKFITTADGMDISLCVIDPEKKLLEFSGGMNDLVHIHNGEIQMLEADHISVSAIYKDFGSFTRKKIRYSGGDVIYLATDGYQDQFGGPRDKKFLRHKFNDLLLEIHKLPMQEQKDILEMKLLDWMGSNIQTDDITVMGILL